MSTALFNIGMAAQRSGVSAKMIRHYETLGLLPQASRSDAGYRRYSDKEVHTLRFIRRARDLGFSMADIARLLDLWQDQQRASADVKHLALQQAAALGQRITQLQQMQHTLQTLAGHCHGDQRPDCPILEGLGDPHTNPDA